MSGKTHNTQNLQIIGMWVFLAPLIVILGTADILTNGRGCSWPFND